MRQTWVRVVAISELVGGVFILFGGWQLVRDSAGHLHVVLPLVMLGAAGLSTAAGRLLILERPSGIGLSMFVQGLQIVSVSGAWRYVFLAGAQLTFVIASAGLRFFAGGGGAFILSNAPADGSLHAPGVSVAVNLGVGGNFETATWALGINLVAAYFFARLWRLDNTLTEEAKRAQQLGQAQVLPNAPIGSDSPIAGNEPQLPRVTE